MSKREKINELIKSNVNEVNTFVTKISGLIYNEEAAIEEVVISGRYPIAYEKLTAVQKEFVSYWQSDNELLEECILLFEYQEE